MASLEKALINSEEYIRKLFEGIPIPIYVWQHYDNDFILIDYNDAANKGLKDKVKKKVGAKASEFYKDNPKIIQDLKKCFVRKKNITKERIYTFKSPQEHKNLSIRYSFIPTDLVLIHIEDITEEKLAKQQMLASEMKLKQLNKELELKVNERTKKLEQSEENYRNLLENLDVGFYQVTLDGHMINLNQAHKIILGYAPTENLKEKDVRMFWKYPEQREKYITLLLEKGSVKDYICHSLTKDGKEIIVELNSHLIRDKQGFPIRIDGTFIDITEKYKLEKKLKVSEERYRLISENANDLIGILNREFKYEYINEKTFSQVLGYTATDIIGKSAIDYVHPEDLSNAVNTLKLGFEKGEGAAEVRFKHKKGHWIWIEAKGTTFLDKDGKLKALIISRDTTERKKADQQLKESEEKFRIITEQSFMAILIMQDFKIKYANQRLLDILGYSLQEILSWKPKEFFNFIYPEDLEKVKEIAEKKYNGIIDVIKNFQFRILTKTGEILWVEIFSKTIHYKGKEADLLSIIDITEKKQAEMKLKESEAKYRAMAELLPDIIYEADLNLNITYVNPIGFKKFGYSPEDLKRGVNIKNLVSPEYIEKAFSTIKSIFKRKITEPNEYLMVRKDGTKFYARLNSRPIIINGKVIGLRGTVTDINDMVLAEHNLKESEIKYREAFDRASFYKDLFAHDINNILQIMNSSAELISLQLNDSNQLKDIENIANIIKKQVSRGTKLVNNVRILSELEESEILNQPTKACDILLKSIEYVKKAYNERDIKVEIDCPDNEIYVIANELLQDVFENILINAIKYNENPSIEILISIFKWTYENNTYYRFEFIDNGIGIQDERKRLIFEKSNGELRSDKGMGLGLSLVSKIVNYYNGKIWIEDKIKGDYSKGSKFIILLPVSN
ncbi:MAG: PAS domain S-box protein [Promethearchaeota archaeon]